MQTNRGFPTPPIELSVPATEAGTQLRGMQVPVSARLLDHLREVCTEVSVDPAVLAESSRDWWPLAQIWATSGHVPAIAPVLVRPASTEEVARTLKACNQAVVPVTAAAGRSGVCGGSVPVHGGVLMDLTRLQGILAIDHESLVLDVAAGTFGDVLEDDLAAQELTVGHWPQSIDLSTVGGWLACRGAGQMSNRYGKIEDMVLGLEVVLADGRIIHAGGHTRAAVGPDLTQLFVGSEGTLGVITGAQLRLHPRPGAPTCAAYGFATFSDANQACRRILQRGARPATLRVYDALEAGPRYDTGDLALLLVRDEGDPVVVQADMAVVAAECVDAETLGSELVDTWWGHRNDASALAALVRKGYVVDTMEITTGWSTLDRVYEAVRAAIGTLPETILVSGHQSHAYNEGACIYFTFAARPERPEDREPWYVAAWDAGTRAALDAGASLSHHHGVGLNRSRFVREALGPAFDVLVTAKEALDPRGILNPSKLGFSSPFGQTHWPSSQ